MERWVLCCVVLCAAVGSAAELQKFYIGGLFPYDSSDPQVRDALGVYPKLAAQLALQRINDGGLLSALNFSMEMLTFGTSCEMDSAVYAYLQLMEALQGRETAGMTACITGWVSSRNLVQGREIEAQRKSCNK